MLDLTVETEFHFKGLISSPGRSVFPEDTCGLSSHLPLSVVPCKTEVLHPINSGTQWGQQMSFKLSEIPLNYLQHVAGMCAVSWGQGEQSSVSFIRFSKGSMTQSRGEPMVKNSKNMDYYSHFIVRENRGIEIGSRSFAA